MNSTEDKHSTETPFASAQSPTPGEFAIVAQNCFPYNTLKMKPSMVEDLMDCGFNAGTFRSSTDAVTSAFDAIGDSGFRLILRDPSLTASQTDCTDFVNLYKNHPALGGWIVTDEARFSKFEAYASYMSLISRLDSSHPVFPVLYGGNSSDIIGAGNDYASYLKGVETTIAPQIWAYSFAPFRRNGCASYLDTSKFYRDLSLISMKGRSPKTFLGTCHCQSRVNFDHELAAPIEARLRFQAFAAIAFGARGIVFDSYHQTPNNNIQTYLLAPVDNEGRKTPVWYYLKRVIQEASLYGRRFLNTEFQGCRYTGESILMCPAMFGGYGIITSLSSGSAGVLVSYYKSGNKNHMLILNRDVDKFQEITFETLPNPSLMEVPSSPLAPDLGDTPSTQKKRTLPPAGYIYLSWDSSVKG